MDCNLNLYQKGFKLTDFGSVWNEECLFGKNKPSVLGKLIRFCLEMILMWQHSSFWSLLNKKRRIKITIDEKIIKSKWYQEISALGFDPFLFSEGFCVF